MEVKNKIKYAIFQSITRYVIKLVSKQTGMGQREGFTLTSPLPLLTLLLAYDRAGPEVNRTRGSFI